MRVPFILATSLSLLARANATAQTAFRAVDGNLSFTAPAGWKAAEDGGEVRLMAQDGAAYTVTVEPSGGAGEPANSPALRAAAEQRAQSLLKSLSYAGVRAATVEGGAGAVYRFRGKGAKGDSDLAEIWFAVVGGHLAVLAPDSAPSPDHTYELSSLVRSIRFADNAKPSATSGKPRTRGIKQPATGKPTDGGGQPAPGAEPTPAPPQAAPAATAHELQGYSGRLREGDVGFALHLMSDRTAKADWTGAVDRSAKYSGRYTGDEGNYVVTLSTASGTAPQGSKGLTLYLRQLGGTVTGQYTVDSTTVRRDIHDLELTSVEAGDSKGGKAGMRGGNGARQRMRGRQRGRRIGMTSANKALIRRANKLAKQAMKKRRILLNALDGEYELHGGALCETRRVRVAEDEVHLRALLA